MMTPGSRPIGVLTPAILATATHWCLLQDGNASVIQTECLGLDAVGLFAIVVSDNSIVPKGTRIRVGFFSATCYPCTLQPNGLVVPEPWPVLDGEEEIEAWRGCSETQWESHKVTANGQCWWLRLKGTGKSIPVYMDLRPNMHPAPRKGNRWVWEKDR